MQRIGTGYDIHRLAAGRRFVLGGVELPADRGPLGHSDGDALLHALIDALLGAAALGDIGGHFPPSDPAWQDADSRKLAARVAAELRAAGWALINVDATVVLESPRLAPQIAAMRQAVATALGIDVTRVSIKAKSNEGLDAVGEGRAVAAHAIALIERPDA
jgi:2-C-methyl-D-erythritol 2,4-cyclodiphosphate synthase